MWTNDRNAYRDFFYSAWGKYKKTEVLSALEAEIVAVIQLHPEYQFIFEDESSRDKNYFPQLGETNPFLHLSLHLGLQEQLSTNRPAGIRDIFEALLQKKRDPHLVQHLMMERISEMMFRASKGIPLDDETYLAELRSIR